MRLLAGLLLGVAAAATLARSIAGTPEARLGALTVASLVVAVEVGLARARAWAAGAAFFVGLCALWAVVALGLRGRLSGIGAFAGVAWSFGVMTASVRARRDG